MRLAGMIVEWVGACQKRRHMMTFGERKATGNARGNQSWKRGIRQVRMSCWKLRNRAIEAETKKEIDKVKKCKQQQTDRKWNLCKQEVKKEKESYKNDKFKLKGRETEKRGY